MWPMTDTVMSLRSLHRSYQVPVLKCKFQVQHWVVAYVFGLPEYVGPTTEGGQEGNCHHPLC